MNVSRRAWLAASLVLPTVCRSVVAKETLSARREPTEVWSVVVIGSGLSGLTAASSALENGASKVLILEKGPMVGGHSQYSSGSMAVVQPYKEQCSSWQDSVEQFVADAITFGGGSGNLEILSKIARDSFRMSEWLKTCGIFFGPVFMAKSGLRPRCIAMPGNAAGRSYVLAVARRAVELGAAIRLNSHVRAFEPTGGGWLVHFEDTSNHTTLSRSLQTKSLIIASGGFTADIIKRTQLDTRLTNDLCTTANPYGTVWDGATGEMIDAAQAAGAAITEGFGLQLLPYWGGRLLDYDGGDIYVDAMGKRFIDETLPWNTIADKLLTMDQRFCWVITDARSHKGASLGLKLLNGIVHKAQSIEEMAYKMQIPSVVLKTTIEKYNQSASRGFDESTGKSIFAQRIEQPPFYFGKETVYVHTSLDGIRTDASARVISAYGLPLDGLFAAGEVVGGIFGNDRMSGLGMANCLVMGAEAGRNAAWHVSEF